FALFLLIFTVVTCVLALVYKNPDARYQPMKDDRVSFLPRLGYQQKDPSDGEIELMALGASAMKGHEKVKDGFVDSDSFGDDTRMRMGYRPGYGDSSSFSKTSLEEGVSTEVSALSIVGYLSNAYRNYQTSQGRVPQLGDGAYNGLPSRGVANDSGRDYL
ncbi:TRP-domain-containing protein, partial [Metschnikowia bicuspidata]